MNDAIEIVSARATLRQPLPRRGAGIRSATGTSSPDSLQAHSFTTNRRLAFAVLARDDIERDLHGPAIVTESTATFYLDAGWRAAVGSHGELVALRSDAE